MKVLMLLCIISGQIIGAQQKNRIQIYTLTYSQSYAKQKPEVHHNCLYIIEVRILPNNLAHLLPFRKLTL